MRLQSLRPFGTLAFAMMMALAALDAPAALPVHASPQTYLVDRTDDVIVTTCSPAGNDCSLRGAVQNANANPGATISLNPLAAYVLTSGGFGELVLSATTAIDSNNGVCFIGACDAVIAGGSGWSTRLLEVVAGAAVTVDHVEFTGGNTNNGGALMNSGALTLTTSLVYSNTVGGWGGGILNYGTLALSNTVVSGNKAGTLGGAIANESNLPQSGIMTIINSTIVTNSVSGQAYGAGITSLDNISGTIHPALTMANSSSISNTGTAGGLGGGLFVDGNNHLTNVTLQGNANGGGAGAYVNGGQFVMQGGAVLSNTGVITGGGGGLYLTGGFTLTNVTALTNVTVAGNSAGGGGGIEVGFAQLSMQGGSVFSNTALTSAGSGGGIRNDGALTLNNVLMSRNQTLGGGAGGAISSGQPFTVTNSTITHNSADGGGGAIWLGGFGARLLLDHSSMVSNTSSYGGGIAGYGTSVITNSSVISGNAGFQGGALNVFGGGSALIGGGSQIMNNSTTGGALGTSKGGGIENQGLVQIENAEISGNVAQNGGGGALYNDIGSQASLTGAALVDNRAGNGSGGGIANLGVLTVTASAIVSNIAVASGGAISNTGSLSLLNTTLGGNGAGVTAGALFNNGQAGLNFVTLADNGSGGDGGLVTTGTVTTTLSLANSLLSGNTGPGAPNCSGTVTSLGYNLIADKTGCALTGPGTGDKLNVDAKLTALIDQGGVLRYYDVLAFSPVLNNADPVVAHCPAADQRGVARPIGPRCDIGAIESSAVAFYYTFAPIARR